VWELARRFGSSTAAIVAANGLDARAVIRVGQVLTIPAGTGARAPAPPPAPASPARHVVAAGETVSELALRYGTTTGAIVAANRLGARAVIRVGQSLVIPRPGAPAAPPMPTTFAGRSYPPATTAAATANRDALLARAVPDREHMRRLVRSTAVAMGVDPALALAVAHQESGFNQRAVSPANAVGTMQVIPSSGVWASDLVGRPLDLLDPEDNVTAGVAILRQLLRSAPNLDTAIASYYQGLGSVRRNGMYADTRRYVASVRALMTRFA
jgi:soluble lytic murein transglycosylase-like protein